MSFFLPELHHEQQHPTFFEYSTSQGPLCLACFLHSIADASELDSRKIYLLREFVRQFGPDGPDGAEPLRQLLSQHAYTLVNGLLSACTASQDLGLSGAVQEAAAAMCCCAPEYLPELCTERVLQLLLELPWPTSLGPATTYPSQQQQSQASSAYAAAAIACCLSILQHLLSTYPAAARPCDAALSQSEELAARMCAGLSCGLEGVVIPLIQTFSVLVCGGISSSSVPAGSPHIASIGGGGAGSCCLAPAVVQELFLQLLLLSPRLGSAELRGLVMQVLLHLVATGYAVEHAALSSQHPSSAAAPLLPPYSQISQLIPGPSQHTQRNTQHQQPHQQQMLQQAEQHSAAVSAAIMTGLKPVLLDTDPSMQLLGCRVLAAAAARAPALLLQQLVASDACEHMFEVLRGTLASCSMSASILDLQQRQQHQQGASAEPAAAAAVAHAATQAEGLQSAAVAALRCLVTQGPSFTEHLHFGLDTLTDLLSHTTVICHTPLQHATLLLLNEALAPAAPTTSSNSMGVSRLPAAALERLAAAAVVVLPEITADDMVGAAAAGGGSDGVLQPAAETLQCYELTCRLMCQICMRWCLTNTNTHLHGPSLAAPASSSSSSKVSTAFTPHVLAAAHKAQLVLSALRSRSLLGGLLPTACELMAAAVQLLGGSLAQQVQQQPNQQHYHQQQMQQQQQSQEKQRQQLTRTQTGKAGLPARRGKQTNSRSTASKAGLQQKGLKRPASTASRSSTAAASQKKLFVRRAQRQQQQQQQEQACGMAADAAHELQQQCLVDDLLCLFEAVVLHLLPAAMRALKALGVGCAGAVPLLPGGAGPVAVAGGGAGAGDVGATWSSMVAAPGQEVGAAEVFQAVVGVLLVVLETGSTSPALSSFLAPFCHQLLSGSGPQWTRTCLDLMPLLQLPPASAALAWQVLLMAAAQLQGHAFLTGSTPTPMSSLAATLSSRVTRRLQLLEVLCSSSSNQQQQQGGFGSLAEPGQHSSSGGSSRQGSSGDIRRFCGVSELHKAVLCLVAAALHCGDFCWELGDVLTALDAAVGHAGPAILSQPELLLHVVRLYAQVEQQLVSELQQQEVLQLQAGEGADAAGCMAAGGAADGRFLQLQQQPPAIVHAVGRMSAAQLMQLHPGDPAAGWVLAEAAVLPGAVQLLLQGWMQQLLTPQATSGGASSVNAPAAASAADGDCEVQRERQQLEPQKQELCEALLAAVVQQPAAVSAILLLLQDCLAAQTLPQQQPQQQYGQQAAAWVAVLTNVLHHCCTQISAATAVQLQHAQQVQYTAGASDVDCSLAILQLLLLGSSPAVGASAGGHTGSSHTTTSNRISRAGSCPGLLPLVNRATMSYTATAGWFRYSSRTWLVVACSKCLTVVAAACSSGSAAAAAVSDGVGKQEVERLLMQQGQQQVLLVAACLQQVPAQHHQYQQLLCNAANMVAAWAHAVRVSAAGGELVLQLAGSTDVTSLMQSAAAAALQAQEGTAVLAQPAVDTQLPLEVEAGTDAALELLLSALYPHCGLDLAHAACATAELCAVTTSGSGGLPAPQSHVCRRAASGNSSKNGSSSREALLVPVLMWQQHLLCLQLAGAVTGNTAALQQQQQHVSNTDASSSSDSGSGFQVGFSSVSGLSMLQMVMLVQGQGPGLLPLLLLNNLNDLLLLKAQQQHLAPQQQAAGASSQQQADLTDDLPWLVLLTVLQNAVAAAAVPGACSWQYTAAAVRSLAALFGAAAAAVPALKAGSGSGSAAAGGSAAAAVVVVSSPWNGAVLQAVLERVCQRAGELQAVGTAAAAAANAAHDSSLAGRLMPGYAWLLDPEVQQYCQLWCADVQLLASFASLAVATAPAGHTCDAPGGAADMLQQLQALLLSVSTEGQQQLLGFLCWGAAQCYSSCQGLMQEDQQQQHQERPGLLAHKAAAACLSMYLAGVCLMLLQGLLDAGYISNQLPWLQQQLQQQAAWINRQQQLAVMAGLQGFVGQCVAVGALQVLSPLQLLDGCAVGRLQGASQQLLLQAYCSSSQAGGSSVPVLVCEPLLVLPQLQQLLEQVHILQQGC